jgi:dienelactone hydrolase
MPSHARVTHGFLDGAQPLFASYHAPTGPARNIAYVVCQPLHLDLIQCYRSMRRCAEELAAAGFHVMRVHYDGTGESVGKTDRDPDRVVAWLESVRRAAAAMAAIPKVEGVGLVGVRIGGTFALETSTRIDVTHLVLWEACPGASYSREMDILASSSPQRVLPGAEPTTGGLVAGGYWLSEQTLADLGRLDLEKMQPRGRPDVLLVHRGDRKPSPRLQQHLERVGCPITVTQLPGHKEMMVMPQKSLVPPAILAAIRDWAVERSRVVGDSASADGPQLAPEAVIDALRWRPIRFGSGDHLFGVITEPKSGVKPDLPAVLLLTGGVTPRTSGNGSYVTLARRLAAKGHAVLRMDVAFIGESGTPDGSEGKENEPFPPSIVDDARAGLERVCAVVAPGTKVWLLGLCSGAYPSFQISLDDRRARGAFFINPAAFHLGQGDLGAPAAEGPVVMTKVDQLEQMQRYWQVMRSAESWKKLLSGKADVRYLANVLRARIVSRLASAKESVAARLGRAPKGLAGDLDQLLAHGMSVHLVFSEGDPAHAGLVTEIGARLDELLRKGLQVTVFPGADHNFHEMSSRGELLDWVEAKIASS